MMSREVTLTLTVTPELASEILNTVKDKAPKAETPNVEVLKAETRETKVTKPKEKKEEKPKASKKALDEDEDLDEDKDDVEDLDDEDDGDDVEDLDEDKDDVEDEDEEEEKPKAKTAQKAKATKVVYEDVQKAIKEYTKSMDDLKAARAGRVKILSKFGVEDPTDLKSSQFQAVIDAFKKATK